MKRAPALGVFEASTYSAAVRPLAAGDMVMLYTDGLFELESADGTLFDKQQLLESVTRRMALPTPQLFDELLAEARAFSGKQDFEDDMCLVGMDFVRLIGGMA